MSESLRPRQNVRVDLVESATPEMAAGMNRLLSHLSSQQEKATIDIDQLGRMIESPSVAQWVARDGRPDREDQILGMATVNILRTGLASKAWLDDFVVSPEVRGLGVAQKIWDAISEWRRENGLRQMRFTSKPARVAAHKFYLKNGCLELASGETHLFLHQI